MIRYDSPERYLRTPLEAPVRPTVRRSVPDLGKGSGSDAAPRWIIGVDPGIQGAIAVLTPQGRVASVDDMPIVTRGKRKLVDGFELDALLTEYSGHGVATVWLEDVNAHKQGRTSALTFGRGLGAIESLVMARRMALEYVTPPVWKKSAGLGRDKAASVDAAKRLYPEIADQLYGPKGGAKDGRAEAILIARYGWRLSRIGAQAHIEEMS